MLILQKAPLYSILQEREKMKKRSNPILDKKYLDGEQLFKVYWQEMGSARSTVRLQRWCLSHSIVNPKTQNVPTRMGLWKAMWRWASENREQAKEIWKISVLDSYAEQANKNYFIEMDWKTLILKNAKTSFQNVRYAKAYYNAN